ncbi:class I mannose-6-phosphate isomerase [bacterium]|nr:class I mannose-6-phosphate isomerase [bacterium]
MRAPIRFERIVLAKPWGGRDLLRRLGVPVPDAPPTGEVWLLSDVEGRPSKVADGPARGATLRELVRSWPREVLGRAHRGAGDARFPLLVKLLEVEGRLSVQVHPDAALARRNGDGGSGKFEAWSVLGTRPAARVSIGLDRASTRDEVRALVEAGRLEQRLNTFSPREGDAYVIAPGTIHAAGGGLLLLEVQETADVTYRLYDWGTVGLDGKPRELHVEKALACADLGARSGRLREPPVRTGAAGIRERPIVEPGAGPFVFSVLDLEDGARLDLDREGLPRVVVALEGECAIELPTGKAALAPGEAALLPACLGGGSLLARGKGRAALAHPAP